MKALPFLRPFPSLVIRPLCAVTVITLLAGCSSLTRRQNDVAADSMQAASAEVQYESRSLELTMGALRDLVNDPGADLKRPFKHFSQSLNNLETSAHRTDNTGKRMETRNAAYLQSWDKRLAGIDYEHVRNISQSRRAEVGTRFEAVRQRYQESQAVVQPMISYLRDIRTALNSDLTMEGVASVKGIVQNAEQNATKVQTALGALANELSNSGARLASISLRADAQTGPSR